MRTFPAARIFAFVCILGFHHPAIAQQPTATSTTWEVYFSPHGGATSAILQTLDNAKSTVLVQACSFTSDPIAEALVRAHERGVKVQRPICRRFVASPKTFNALYPTHLLCLPWKISGGC